MTPRENALLAYRHQPHPSVPNFFTDFDIWDSFGERYFGPGEGKDWFGVSWTHVPEMNSQTETPGQELLEDLEHWRDQAARSRHSAQPHMAEIQALKEDFVTATHVERYE